MIKKHIPRSFERFLDSFPSFKKLSQESKMPRIIYDFLSEPKNIHKMQEAARLGNTPLTGILDELEKTFQKNIYFKENLNYRKMVGSMIAEILYNFGWRKRGQKRFKNTSFTSASYYELSNQDIKEEIVVEVSIRKVEN